MTPYELERSQSCLRRIMTTVMFALFFCCTARAQPAVHHNKEFWKKIAENKYQVPAGESAASLIDDLTDNLGSPDPELRDELVHGISAVWIYRNGLFSGDELRPLIRKCENNLTVGIGEQGTDTVLLRSFSALELSLIAAFDNKKRFLTDADFAGLLNSALNYFNAERDIRGYDPQKGWMHATAHTSDLLKFLGRNSRLKVTDQAKILDAISKKVHQDGHNFVFGENERMAAAVLSLARRSDFDQSNFQAFLNRLAAESNSLWSTQPLNLDEFAAIQNAKDLLRSLVVQINFVDHAEAAAESAKQSILATLKRMP